VNAFDILAEGFEQLALSGSSKTMASIDHGT